MNKQNDKKEGRKQNKDINTRTNKLAKIMLIVLIAIFTLAILIVLNRENIIELGDNINNLIERRNSELVKGEEKGVTDIDLTGLVTGEDTEHTHIYETVTNSTEHWKQCIICNNKIDVEKHILGEKIWAAGSESCEKNNFYTQRCKCGYQVKGRKPCIWDGHSYERTTNYRHIKTCNVCKGQIDNEYYIENDLNTLYVNKIEQCVNSKGNITCSNLGICDVCNSNWNSSPHQLNAKAGGMVGTSEIYCQRCNKSFGTVEFNITNNHSAPSTYTGNLTVNLTNGATIDTTHNGTVREIGKPFETINSVRTDISSTSAKYTISSTFKNIWKEYYFAYYIVSVVINGYKTSIYLCNSFYMYPDTKVQQVPTVQVMDSEEIEGDWATNKEIKISGDEDYCNYVTVKIKDDAGKEIFSGKATAKNGKYALSCIPELEADANGRTFQVEVTDSNNNSITKEFKVDRVDSKAPTLIESGEYTKEWSKNKEISFTAEDKGVGNVEIAFNNANDYQSATKENDRYVRKYNFYGDVYDKVTAAIYLKDGLGNERTVKVDIGKLDNTAPKITETNIAEGKVKITSNDRHEKLGGGSGIVGYRYLTSMEEINEEITESMGTYIEAQEIPLDELKKAKYVYIAPVDRAGNIGNTVKVDLPTYSYSVNYYEEGSQTKVAQSKIVENKLLGEEVEEQAIDIEGYVKVEPSTKKITIKQSENKIDFLYRKRTDISYTVKYLEKGTNKEIYERNVVANQTFGDTITEQAIDIPGYDLGSAQEQNLTIKVDGNEIIFYYVKSDTNVLVHHYKEGITEKVPSKNGGEVEMK